MTQETCASGCFGLRLLYLTVFQKKLHVQCSLVCAVAHQFGCVGCKLNCVARMCCHVFLLCIAPAFFLLIYLTTTRYYIRQLTQDFSHWVHSVLAIHNIIMDNNSGPPASLSQSGCGQ